jgi:hypothetical protein
MTFFRSCFSFFLFFFLFWLVLAPGGGAGEVGCLISYLRLYICYDRKAVICNMKKQTNKHRHLCGPGWRSEMLGPRQSGRCFRRSHTDRAFHSPGTKQNSRSTGQIPEHGSGCLMAETARCKGAVKRAFFIRQHIHALPPVLSQPPLPLPTPPHPPDHSIIFPMASLLALIDRLSVHECQQIMEMLSGGRRLALFQLLLHAARLGIECSPVM